MKLTTLPLVSSCVVLAVATGCIKDELPNIDADILGVSTDNASVLNIVEHWGSIDVYGTPSLDASDLSLEFTLSPGATINPDPSDMTDYSEPRVFTVTSEDGEWSRSYVVSVSFSQMPTVFDFEHWMQPEGMRYQIAYELTPAEQGASDMYIWASGNEAFNFLTTKYDDYTAFPTQPTTESHGGRYAAKLVTHTTPEITRPIASGNLFIGQFDAKMLEPCESTQFGLPFMKKPVRFRGWIRYRSGGMKRISNEPDQYRVRAVLYRTDAATHHLNGFTIQDSPNIVAHAMATGGDTPGDGYVEFDLPFEYSGEIDADALRDGGYNMAVIFSSSCDGDVYDGAKGSTLLVDDVEIICDSEL